MRYGSSIRATRNKEQNMTDFSENDDIIDTRDVQERIEELQQELDLDEDGEPNEYDAEDERPEPLDPDVKSELEEELEELMELKREVSSYSGDRFEDGATLIAEEHFEDYAKELAEDLHGEAIRQAAWPFDNIDWDAAADDLKVDYTKVEFRGYDFWVRN
jgi:hypothetical protein